MENNDYYEPKIKTLRNDEPKIIINYDNYIEKKQLISFLENEITTKQEILDKKQKIDNSYYVIRGEKNECHRILDFIKKSQELKGEIDNERK